MITFYRRNKENIDKVLYFIVFILFIYLFFNYMISYLSPLIIGYIFCVILYPIVNVLQTKLKFPRGMASLLAIMLLIASIGILSVSIVSKIIIEAGEFTESIPYYLDDAASLIESLNDKYYIVFSIFPEELHNSVEAIISGFMDSVTAFLTSGVKSGSVKIVKNLPNTMMVLILSLISTFFLLRDRDGIEEFIKRQLPESVRGRFKAMQTGLFGALIGYVRAQLILMSIIAVICITGLTILRYPHALFVGLIISVIDAVPIFGSGFVLWPWCILSLLAGDYKKAVGLIIIYLIILMTRQTLEPRILGHQIGVHPLLTLISMYVGLRVFGLFGFIIGPVIVLTLKAFQEADLFPRWK